MQWYKSRYIRKTFKVILILLAFALCAIAAMGLYYKLIISGNGSGVDNATAYRSILMPADAVNYAESVDLRNADAEVYTAVSDQGLFWAALDAKSGSIIEMKADTTEGAALIDPSKPTLIFTHGIAPDGHAERLDLGINDYIDSSVFGFSSDADLIQIAIDAGFNVGIYHWEKFASESYFDAYKLESKFWSNSYGSSGMRFKYPDGSFSSHDLFEYSLAEYFAAEYARAASLMPEGFGEREIRFVGHSMGGQLSVVACFLICELIRIGQLPEHVAPNRLSLLDPYFSMRPPLTPRKLYIRWTSEKLHDSIPNTLLRCLAQLHERGVATEYYANSSSQILGYMHKDTVSGLKKVSAWVIIEPEWENVVPNSGYTMRFNAHNAIIDWYFISLLFDTPVTYGGNPAPSASLPTDYLFEQCVGNSYQMIEGCTTVESSDDIFVWVIE